MAEGDIQYRFRTPDGQEHDLPADAPLYTALADGTFAHLYRVHQLVLEALAGKGELSARLEKPRGPRPRERRRIIEQMRVGIERGTYTLMGLREMKQAALEVEFDAHHDTVEAALREIERNSCRTN